MEEKKVSMFCMVNPGPETKPGKKPRFPMLYRNIVSERKTWKFCRVQGGLKF